MDDFYAARSRITPPLPWSNFAPPFSLINGTFRQFQHSPTIRFAASCVASLFWMLFTMGILSAWWDAGGSPTGIVAYGTLLCLELRNAYVSRVDMAATREVRNAGTYR